MLLLDCYISFNLIKMKRMTAKNDLKVRGLTQSQKDFLYDYAQKNLGCKSRSKAILHLVNEKMPKDKQVIQGGLIQQNGESKERIQISLRKNDYDLLKAITEEEDTSMQYYIISLILKDLYNHKRLNGKELELLRQSNYQLYKIGVNLNQIAKAMNAGEEKELAIEQLTEFINSHVEQVKILLNNTLERY